MHQIPIQKRGRWGLVFALLAMVLAPLGWLAVPTPPAYAQSGGTKTFYYSRYDSDFTINQDGTFDAVETQTLQYTSGTFQGAFRYWDLSRVEDFTNIQVSENGQPYRLYTGSYDLDNGPLPPANTYITQRRGNQLYVYFFHSPVRSPASQTFEIRYHVVGGIRIYPDGDQFFWQALPPDRTTRIDNARVTVHLPSGVNMADVKTAVYPAEMVEMGLGANNTVTFDSNRTIRSGDTMEVRVQWPHGIVTSAVPSWQAADDAQREQEAQQAEFKRTWGAVISLGALLLSALVLIGGIFFWAIRWYRGGRDTVSPLVADYLTEPPSDLPAGLVGTLVDESADVRDVIASIVDLARKGHITIEEVKEGGIAGMFQNQDFVYTLNSGKVENQFEDSLLRALFAGQQSIRLSELKNRFYRQLPSLYEQMYKALVGQKYFDRSPASVRGMNQGLAIVIIVLAFLSFFAVGFVADITSGFIFALPFAIGIVGLVGLVFAGVMPRKTEFGSDQAQRWRAFGRYLQNIRQYTNVEEAAKRFDQYLPYAMALGVQEDMVRQFQNVLVATGGWYIPLGWGYGPQYYGGGGGGSGAF